MPLCNVRLPPGPGATEDSGYPRTWLTRWPGWPGLRTVGAGSFPHGAGITAAEQFARGAGDSGGQPALTFAGLLRQLRAEARLTQEELAEAAGLSSRSVSDLERGVNRTARKDTAVLLAGALNLPSRRASYSSRRLADGPLRLRCWRPGRGTPGAFAAAATRSLPRDIASFTGREAELARAYGRGRGRRGGGVVGIHAIGGMAGVGKTTFAVHAAHRLAPAFPDGQFFLAAARAIPPGSGRWTPPMRWPARC